MTNAPRPTKNQRREEAREAARVAREKAIKRQKLLKWLIPTIASVAILAIVGGVVWAVIAFQPPPKKEAGPANMISDGIVFEADGDGGVQYVPTAAIKKGDDPVPTEQREGVLNIVTYVDFTCPACKQFEEAYASSLRSLVAAGQATLEVKQVAILDEYFTGRDVSTRTNNVGACVANYAPESYLDVMDALFANQATEGTAGMSNQELVDQVRNAGLENTDVEECITGESFTPWVQAATQRATIRSTPTIIINGTEWDRSAGFDEFVNSELAKLPTGDDAESE